MHDGHANTYTFGCMLASLRQGFAKVNQEFILVEMRKVESNQSRTKIEHKWTSKGGRKTYLGLHTLAIFFL